MCSQSSCLCFPTFPEVKAPHRKSQWYKTKCCEYGVQRSNEGKLCKGILRAAVLTWPGLVPAIRSFLPSTLTSAQERWGFSGCNLIPLVQVVLAQVGGGGGIKNIYIDPILTKCHLILNEQACTLFLCAYVYMNTYAHGTILTPWSLLLPLCLTHSHNYASNSSSVT